MKRGILLFISLIMLTSCGKTPTEVETTKTESEETTILLTTEVTTITTEPPVSETSSDPKAPYYTKELSRDGEYKLMEMYVYDDTWNTSSWNTSRRITFEIPVEWLGEFSVFTNGEDYQYTLKVDMWNVLSATRDDVLVEINMSDDLIDIISETIYSTENYEIFKYECTFTEGEANRIFIYYLYANGERLHISSYVFGEYLLEYEEIFTRIIESVQFQF